MRRQIKLSHRSSESGEALINLTPLIDIVFVMLIMFIVVAPILDLDQVELAGAGVDSKEVSSAIKDTSPIAIHVRKDNTVLFNGQKVTQEKLKKLLIEAKNRFPAATPLLFHDKHAYFGTYQNVKNAVEASGFKDMNIILNPSVR